MDLIEKIKNKFKNRRKADENSSINYQYADENYPNIDSDYLLNREPFNNKPQENKFEGIGEPVENSQNSEATSEENEFYPMKITTASDLNYANKKTADENPTVKRIPKETPIEDVLEDEIAENERNPFEYDIEIDRELRGYNRRQVEDYIIKLTDEYNRMYEEFEGLQGENETLKQRVLYFEQHATEIFEAVLDARAIKKKAARNNELQRQAVNPKVQQVSTELGNLQRKQTGTQIGNINPIRANERVKKETKVIPIKQTDSGVTAIPTTRTQRANNNLTSDDLIVMPMEEFTEYITNLASIGGVSYG